MSGFPSLVCERARSAVPPPPLKKREEKEPVNARDHVSVFWVPEGIASRSPLALCAVPKAFASRTAGETKAN